MEGGDCDNRVGQDRAVVEFGVVQRHLGRVGLWPLARRIREICPAGRGGRRVRPNDPEQLAGELHRLLLDERARLELANSGLRAVHQHYHAEAMARGTLEVWQRFLC